MALNSATDQVIESIKDEIRSGALMPGQRLVEKELGERIGVGRGAVREALRALESDGFLIIERHRGASVKKFSREEVWAQHQVREMLEGLAAALAAERIATSIHRVEFLDTVNRMKETAERGDLDGYLRLNYRFHGLIALMSGNPIIQEHIDRTRAAQLRLHAARFMTQDGMQRSHREHVPIIDAILGEAPERAETAMREHIRGTRRTFIEMPDSMFAP